MNGDQSYGLDSPKLALQADGGVFIAGKPIGLDAPAAPVQGFAAGGKTKTFAAKGVMGQRGQMGMNGQPMSLAPQTAGAPGWLSVFCQSGSNWRVWAPQPEEAALSTPTVAWTTVDSSFPPSIPTRARISIPLPIEADDSGTSPLWRGVNRRHRYFILKVQRPSKNLEVAAVTVTLNAGDQTQTVLSKQSVAAGIGVNPFDPCARILPPDEVPLVEQIISINGMLPEDQFTAGSDHDDFADERNREFVRKEWIRNGTWRPSGQSSRTEEFNKLTDYYRVRVTFDENNPSHIRYGLINGQMVPTPSATITYRFKLHYTVLGLPISQPLEIDAGHCTVIPHWSAAQFFSTQRFSSWNNDKWCSQPLFAWFQDQGNRESIGPTNDISLEHGRNTSHKSEHFRGDAVDVYHPGFSSLIGTNANGSPTESGGTFMNTRILGLLANAKAGDSTARGQLASWIFQARLDLQHMLERMNGPNGNFVGSGLYLRSTGDGTNTQYVDVRSLIWTGQCSGLNLTQITVNGGANTLGAWTWGTPAQRSAFTWDNTGNVHTTHMHIRPQGAQPNQ